MFYKITKLLSYSCICLVSIVQTLYAQGKYIHVDHSTGTANVNIPLYEVKFGSLSIPVSLNYSATGVRVNDVEGSAGVGWNLIAGGAIRRQLRGLPDDVTTNVAGNTILGWMNSNSYAQALVRAFISSNDNNSATCQDETNDINYINTYLPNNEDTEPDIFSVNAPGLSCQLIFDRSIGNFRTIPYRDVKISYTTDNTGITSFNLKDDKGTTYTFAAVERSWKQMSNNTNTSPPYYASAYNQFQATIATTPGSPYASYYDPSTGVTTVYFSAARYSTTGGVHYNGGWNLTSIRDVYGNTMTLNYTIGMTKSYFSPVSYFLSGSSTPTQLYFEAGGTITPNLLSTITYSNPAQYYSNTLSFVWRINPTTQKSIISSIVGFGRNFQFNYNNVSTGTHGFNRYFLNNVVDPACSTPFNYAFNYYKPELLPDSTSSAIDYWGYYNGNTTNTNLKPDVLINPSNPSLPRYTFPQKIVSPSNQTPSTNYTSSYQFEITGSNRLPSPYDVYQLASNNTIGTLTSISYGNGGGTKLTYEPNDYYDAAIGGTVLGGGIRVTSISDGPNFDPQNPSTQKVNYSYLNPSTGYSSGAPVTLPMFAFTIPYLGTATGSSYWTSSTATSYADLSIEDHTVYYSTVTESMSGAGVTVHQFLNPGTYGSNNIVSPLLPWQPTTIYVGRNKNSDNSCPSVGALQNDINTYPFPPNTNYDFERGLPYKTTYYNSNSQTLTEVSETAFTYSTPAAAVINGFKYDFSNQTSPGVATAYNYSKYAVYASTEPLLVKVSTKNFDLGSTTISKQVDKNYSYIGNNHMQPTQVSTTNSDGTVNSTNIKYVKDYVIPAAATPGDNFSAGIQNLQSNNINIPVETYNQLTTAGANPSTVTNNGSLVKFSLFKLLNGAINASTNTVAMPSQKLILFNTNGIGAFQPSSINSSYNFIYDSNYLNSKNFYAYDYGGALVTSDNGFNHLQTKIFNHQNSLPEAIFDNASFDQVGFSDFDSFSSSTDFSGVIASGSGHIGFGAQFATGNTITKTVSRNISASNYIFSFWLNSSITGHINVTLSGTGSSGNSISYSVPVTFTSTVIPNTTTGWKYFEVSLSLTGITSSTVTLSATTDQTIQVDDLILYPGIAKVISYDFDATTFVPTGTTDTNGNSTYYNYDQFGRPLYIYDKDKNITQRFSYLSLMNLENALPGFPVNPAFNISINGRVVTCTDKSFSTPCVTGPTIYWDFGDSNTVSSVGQAAVTHTYSSSGDYTIKLSVGGTFSTTHVHIQ